jgi:hypothetical protein
VNAVANMERQRLREAEPRRDLNDDEMLEAVNTLMRINPRYRAAMEELIADFLIVKGENLAITMGIDFPPEF